MSVRTRTSGSGLPHSSKNWTRAWFRDQLEGMKLRKLVLPLIALGMMTTMMLVESLQRSQAQHQATHSLSQR